METESQFVKGGCRMKIIENIQKTLTCELEGQCLFESQIEKQ